MASRWRARCTVIDLAVLHEDDEDRDIGIQAIDEVERSLHLLGGLIERAQHESVAVVNAVLAEECA